jgi:glycosyltransferase involved in cell wall biosynthesis
MDVSVLICTWNNSARLAVTLEALTKCIRPPGLRWQVVVVNNRCTDDTDQVVRAFTGRLPLVGVFEPEQGLSHARNAGLRAASGKLVLFTDDDVRPYPDWLSAYWTSYQEKGSRCYYGGPVEPEFEADNFDRDLLPLAPYSVRGLDWGTEARALRPRELFIGPNWACPAEAVRKVGGFDPRLGLNSSRSTLCVAEETDLMRRLQRAGLAAWYVPGARLRHFVPAPKCTLEHIAERIAAGAAYRAERWLDYSNGTTILGVPLRLGRELLAAWVKWAGRRASGQKGYPEYIRWRRALGSLRGVRKRSRGTAA